MTLPTPILAAAFAWSLVDRQNLYFSSKSSISPASASSSLELNHSLSPLLIKDPVPALLAPNGIASLQRDLAVAVAAHIVDGGPLAGKAATERIAGGLRGGNGGLVGFARHVCGGCGCGCLKDCNAERGWQRGSLESGWLKIWEGKGLERPGRGGAEISSTYTTGRLGKRRGFLSGS